MQGALAGIVLAFLAQTASAGIVSQGRCTWDYSDVLTWDLDQDAGRAVAVWEQAMGSFRPVLIDVRPHDEGFKMNFRASPGPFGRESELVVMELHGSLRIAAIGYTALSGGGHAVDTVMSFTEADCDYSFGW